MGGFLWVFCILGVLGLFFFSLGHICLTGKEVSVTENKTSLISL